MRVSGRGDPARVYLRGDEWRSGSVHFLPVRRNVWEVDRPMTLRLNTAFVEGELALETIEVTRVDLDGTFNDLTLSLGGTPYRHAREPGGRLQSSGARGT